MRGAGGRRIAKAICALLLSAALGVVSARSGAQEVSGVVLALDGSEVIVDLGKKQGVSDNDVLELWRPIKLKHPVTGKLVSDRFRIGALKITQVRDVMSLAKPTAPLARPVEAGDVVILVGVAKPPLVTPPPTKPTGSGAPVPAPTAPPVVVDADPEVRALGTLFESLHGTSPEVRAKAYDDFIKANPKSRFAGVLQEEILALRKAGAAAPGSAPAPGPAEPPPGPRVRSWRKVDEAIADTPLAIAIELEGPVAGAVLHVRTVDDLAFTSIPFVARGDGYYAVTIPRDRLRPPTMTWFVEAVGTDGKATAVIGSASEPIPTKVSTKALALTPLKHTNSAVIWTDYADYNRWRGNDWAFQTEGYFGMRFGDAGVRAVRSGFGVYRGKGGSIQELDRDVPPKEPRSVGLSYGYLEGEFGIDSFWSMIARAIVGLGDSGVNGGAQGFLRIGNDQKTNLMIGGEVLGGIGLRGITQLQLAIFPRIPILVRSEVTNQPAGESKRTDPLDPTPRASEVGDIGVRAIVQLGYQITPGFTLFVRGSYQGRTIVHAGPGFGAGASVAWLCARSIRSSTSRSPRPTRSRRARSHRSRPRRSRARRRRRSTPRRSRRSRLRARARARVRVRRPRCASRSITRRCPPRSRTRSSTSRRTSRAPTSSNTWSSSIATARSSRSSPSSAATATDTSRAFPPST